MLYLARQTAALAIIHIPVHIWNDFNLDMFYQKHNAAVKNSIAHFRSCKSLLALCVLVIEPPNLFTSVEFDTLIMQHSLSPTKKKKKEVKEKKDRFLF